jgi:hypothetical protein
MVGGSNLGGKDGVLHQAGRPLDQKGLVVYIDEHTK